MIGADGARPARILALTDGKIGDEVQVLGVAEALGAPFDYRIVRPRRLFAALAPFGPIDPRDAPGRAGGVLAGPAPDLAIGSGRRVVPYLRALRRASRGATFTAFLKDPRTGAGTADLIWVGEHDRLRGENVLVTLTAPHRVSQARLAAARAAPDPRLAPLAPPRVAVVVGGNNRRTRYDAADAARLVADLRAVAAGGASLMITPSRRTPPDLAAGLARLAAETGAFYWDGSGENPYFAMLALADAVVATSDSTNMLGEAAATGVPVLVFAPGGGHARFEPLVRGLAALGAAQPFEGRLPTGRYPPVDATPVVARAIAERFARKRAALGLEPAALGAALASGE